MESCSIPGVKWLIASLSYDLEKKIFAECKKNLTDSKGKVLIQIESGITKEEVEELTRFSLAKPITGGQ